MLREIGDAFYKVIGNNLKITHKFRSHLSPIPTPLDKIENNIRFPSPVNID